MLGWFAIFLESNGSDDRLSFYYTLSPMFYNLELYWKSSLSQWTKNYPNYKILIPSYSSGVLVLGISSIKSSTSMVLFFHQNGTLLSSFDFHDPLVGYSSTYGSGVWTVVTHSQLYFIESTDIDFGNASWIITRNYSFGSQYATSWPSMDMSIVSYICLNQSVIGIARKKTENESLLILDLHLNEQCKGSPIPIDQSISGLGNMLVRTEGYLHIITATQNNSNPPSGILPYWATPVLIMSSILISLCCTIAITDLYGKKRKFYREIN
jgi:hypothetical protein